MNYISELLVANVKFYDGVKDFVHYSKAFGFVDANNCRMLNNNVVMFFLICEGLTAFNNNPEYDEIFKAMGRKIEAPYFTNENKHTRRLYFSLLNENKIHVNKNNFYDDVIRFSKTRGDDGINTTLLDLICEGLTAFNNNPEYDEIFKTMGKKISTPAPAH